MRGRPTLAASQPNTVRAMIYLRQFCNLTIKEIASATGASISSVNRYTAHIPCARRHSVTKIFNNKVGIVGRHFIPRLKVAAGRKVK